MSIALPFMPSPNFYPGRPLPIQALVMHSVESDITAGIAKSLAGPNWFGSTKAGTSANAIFDQTGGVEMVKPTDRAWHVGGGNDYTYGTEHAGRAAFTAAQWLTADGKAMLTASARWNRQVADAHGIPWVRLTVDELRAGKRGLTTHNDCRLVWGGTTHTDPRWADEVWSFYLAAGSPTPPAPRNPNDWSALMAGLNYWYSFVRQTPSGHIYLVNHADFNYTLVPNPAYLDQIRADKAAAGFPVKPGQDSTDNMTRFGIEQKAA